MGPTFPSRVELRQSGCDLRVKILFRDLFEFAENFRRPWDVEDVVVFPVPVVGDIEVARQKLTIVTDDSFKFGSLPNVELAFHTFAVGVLSRVEAAAGI